MIFLKYFFVELTNNFDLQKQEEIENYLLVQLAYPVETSPTIFYKLSKYYSFLMKIKRKIKNSKLPKKISSTSTIINHFTITHFRLQFYTINTVF